MFDFSYKPVKKFSVPGPDGKPVEIERGCRFASTILGGIRFKGAGTILGITVNTSSNGKALSLAYVALRVDPNDELRALAELIAKGGPSGFDKDNDDRPSFTSLQGMVMVGEAVERAIREGEMWIVDEPRDAEILAAARAYRAVMAEYDSHAGGAVPDGIMTRLDSAAGALQALLARGFRA